MNGDGPKMVHLDQKWPNMAGLSTLHSGPKGSKRNLNCQPKRFGPLGTILGPCGPFWTISNKNWFFAPKHLFQTLLCPFGAKKSFLSEMVQKGPDGPKRGSNPNGQKHLGWPFGSLLDHFGALTSLQCLAIFGDFLDQIFEIDTDTLEIRGKVW